MVGRIKMKLDMQVGLSPGHIVLDGDPAPPRLKGGGVAQFLTCICCGQVAGWIKMPLGMEVGLGPGDCVRWGPSHTPPKKGQSPTIFGPRLLWSNGWTDQDATWYGGRPRPRQLCVRWGPISPPLMGTAPNFRPMSVVAKLLDGLRCHLVWR